MQSLVEQEYYSEGGGRAYTFRNVAFAWLTTSISSSTPVLVLVLKFRREVSSCLETDTPAGDSTLSKRRGRGLEGRKGILRASRGFGRELRTSSQHDPNEDTCSGEELQFSRLNCNNQRWHGRGHLQSYTPTLHESLTKEMCCGTDRDLSVRGMFARAYLMTLLSFLNASWKQKAMCLEVHYYYSMPL